MVRLVVMTMLAAVAASANADSQSDQVTGQLGDWEVRSGDGVTEYLHQRLNRPPGMLIALSASSSQEDGMAQQEAFLSTHQQLADSLTELPPIAHLNIIAGAPGLVKGFIRRGIVRGYADPIQPEDIWLFFPDDYTAYERQTGLRVGASGHWVWVNDQGHIRWYIEQQGDGTVDALLDRLVEQDWNTAP